MRADLVLPYWKQGDDMAQCLGNAKGNVVEALRENAERFKGVANILLGLADEFSAVPAGEVQIDADTHCISVSGPDALIEKLIEKDILVQIPDDEDEEDDDEEMEIPRYTGPNLA